MPKQKQIKPMSLAAAFQILGKQIVLQKSSSSVRKARRRLTVKSHRIGPIEYWKVEGGSCSHLVGIQPVDVTASLIGIRPQRIKFLACIDHSPAHKPMKSGQACSHISAVQLMLAQEIMAKEKIK